MANFFREKFCGSEITPAPEASLSADGAKYNEVSQRNVAGSAANACDRHKNRPQELAWEEVFPVRKATSRSPLASQYR